MIGSPGAAATGRASWWSLPPRVVSLLRRPLVSISRGGRPAGEARRRHQRLVLPGVSIVYAAIATAAYLPTLPLSGSQTQICTCGDTAQEVWFLGWVPFALTHGHSIFYSNYVLYPQGVNLVDNTAMPLLGLLAAPVTWLAGPVSAYNLVLRAGFALSALAMFVTVRRLVRWWPAAFLAGLAYGFAPFMVGQGLSHEFLVFSPIPPLVFGLMYDVLGQRSLAARRAGIGLGLLFAAQFLIASEVTGMMALFVVLAAAGALLYRQARNAAFVRHVAATAAWAGGVCAVIVAYPLWMFFAGPDRIVGPPHPLPGLYRSHGDLLGALVPTPLMRFAPAGLLHLGSQLVHGNLQERSGAYLGLPLAALAVVLAIAYRRVTVTAIAGVLAVVSYALSLGPTIDVANHSTGIPGPSPCSRGCLCCRMSSPSGSASVLPFSSR